MEKTQPVVALLGYDPEEGYYLGTFTNEGRTISHYVRPTEDGQPPDLVPLLAGVKQVQQEARERGLPDPDGDRIIQVLESYLAGQGYPLENRS